MKKKIAVITSDDSTWLLSTWAASFELLSKDYEMMGIWLLPDKLGKRKGIEVPLWYLQTFGVISTFCLVLFAIARKIKLRFSETGSWLALVKKHGAVLEFSQSANDPKIIDWVKKNEIDILVITTGHILKDEILKAPKIGVINKHAALLPGCRGVFPYFWAVVNDFELGVSFHVVNTEIDGGKLLLQKTYRDIKPNQRSSLTMLQFYIDIYNVFPALLKESVDNFVAGKFLPTRPVSEGSYFSFPTRADYLKFRSKGGRIASLFDFLELEP